jgi:microcystin-dependent protein
MRYTVNAETFLEIPITTGTIQNVSNTDIEVSNEQVVGSGLVLKAGEMVGFNNTTVYVCARPVLEGGTGIISVVPFSIKGEGGGGGGSYVLPVATTSKLGGVKANDADGGVSVASDGKMTINLPNATSSTLGGVKSSTADGKVSVNSDGTMSMNGNPNDGTPTGTVISFFGLTPPTGYLACDGTAYNIADYQALADHINTQFGSYSYFGGDGTTTFAVPDLRGEFLRGTGTNSHTNQGSGASVGVHQDGTNHTYVYGWQNNIIGLNVANQSTTGQNVGISNVDKGIGRVGILSVTATSLSIASTIDYSTFTSRPTNTSVLYCIKC